MKYLFLAFAFISLVHVNAQERPNKSQKTKSNTAISNKIDPICSMAVNNTAKDTAHYKGKVVGFCSSHCKAEFKKNPKKYQKLK